MSRITKEEVRDALISLNAKGVSISIDKVRAELGDRGSKTTIHKYMKELDIEGLKPSQENLNDKITSLIASLSNELELNAKSIVEKNSSRYEQQIQDLEKRLSESEENSESLSIDISNLKSDLEDQLTIAKEQGLEITSLEKSILKLEQLVESRDLIIIEKNEQIKSLEDKHIQSRQALEHYRESVKEQRQKESAKHDDEIANLNRELKNEQSIHAATKENLSKKEKDLALSNDRNQVLLQANSQLEKDNRLLEESNRQIQSTLEKAKTGLLQASHTEELLRKEIEDLKKKNYELTTRAETLEDLNREARDKNISLESAVAAKNEIISQFAPGNNP